MKAKIKLFIYATILLIAAGALSIFLIDYYVSSTGEEYIVDDYNKVSEAEAIIVFGAYVFPDGRVSDILRDRLDVGYELYQKDKAPRIIVTGDHGQKNYDEVNSMRKYLQDKGVPREDIFMDHAGFSTYDSLYRARDVFLVSDAILVTQEFHLVRALYIADKLGIDACGVPSDKRAYTRMSYYRKRELGARTKAFIQAGIFKPEPEFLGETIPIWKEGVLTDD